jgi:hypothetical protein
MKIFHHLFKRFQFLIIATSTALLIILFGLVIQLIIKKIDNKIIVDSNIESIPNP